MRAVTAPVYISKAFVVSTSSPLLPTSAPLLPVVKSAWPLFVGLTLLMIGNGLQGTLLSLRADIEGFDLTTTGLVMSLYYVGYVAGSVMAPKMLQRVGHIRVFAALASLAATTVLLHYVFVNPWAWGGSRIITGFAYAGLYVVIESWLNGMATNATRGKILSVYMFLCYMGIMIGQLLLKVASPEDAELFVLTSILISLAVLPISLSRRQPPQFEEKPQRLKLTELYKISPLGVVATCSAGLISASFMTIAPIYVTELGMDVGDVAVFMAILVLGGMVMQYPVGIVSDKYDRRFIMMITTIGAGIMAVLCGLVATGDAGWAFYLCAFMFWGFATPVYALSASYTNDLLRRDQIVAASGALILLNGAGAAFGPFLLSAAMKVTGNGSFFVIFAVMYAMLTAFIFYRMRRRPVAPMVEKTYFTNMSDVNTPASAELVDGRES